jgi:hypothetical protein
MHGGGEREACDAEEKAAAILWVEGSGARGDIERGGERKNHCGSGEAARGGVGVHKEERGTGNGERKPAGEENDCSGARAATGPTARREHPRGEERQPDAGEMEREENDGKGQAGQSHRGSDGGSEEGVTHWFQHEGRGVRVERGVEQAIDPG